ncbi:alpha/beta hydrolase [uncultured Microbacterium sp.]|uniref:alpha/beta fold hydrolase n=1 Tax=uncultured Microbacterium sp. TaxID=191216 RepID=UPI0026172013|nr:alpha/beta hydrolase [uncultured Microbacterium sp.]
MTVRTHRLVSLPVAGGDLTVGVWDAEDPDAPTILAVHGVTSSHLAWEQLAAALPGVRIVAPDLRGRGQSNMLRGPAGMHAHAADLAAVVAALDLGPTLVVGHSMGGFVSVVFAHRYPDLVTRLVLVDGGLPLAAPSGLGPDELVAAILGPTAARLSMRFADVEAYLGFWRQHPAFVGEWTPEFERYLAYDLVPDGDAFRPATSYATTIEDTVDLHTGTTIHEAVHALSRSTTLITVPRGLQNDPPGLYPLDHLAALLAQYPDIAHQRWDEFNHYTVVLGQAGAGALAGVIAGHLAAPAR